MIQVVPTITDQVLTPAQIFANAIANAVASVASAKSSPTVPKPDLPSPVVVKPTLPVAPVQPVTIPVVPPSPEEPQQVLQTHMSPLLLPLPVAKKAISLPPLPGWLFKLFFIINVTNTDIYLPRLYTVFVV